MNEKNEEFLDLAGEKNNSRDEITKELIDDFADRNFFNDEAKEAYKIFVDDVITPDLKEENFSADTFYDAMKEEIENSKEDFVSYVKNVQELLNEDKESLYTEDYSEYNSEDYSEYNSEYNSEDDSEYNSDDRLNFWEKALEGSDDNFISNEVDAFMKESGLDAIDEHGFIKEDLENYTKDFLEDNNFSEAFEQAVEKMSEENGFTNSEDSNEKLSNLESEFASLNNNESSIKTDEYESKSLENQSNIRM